MKPNSYKKDKNFVKKSKKQVKKKALSLPGKSRFLPDEYKDLNLTIRQFLFVAAYCSHFNGKRAFIQAGYKISSEKAAEAGSARLMKKARVQEAIKRFIYTVIKPYKDVLIFRLIETLYVRAFFQVDTFYYPDGKTKPLNEIPETWSPVIDDIKIKPVNGGRKDIIYELSTRSEALKMLFQIMNKAGEEKQDNCLSAIKQEKIRKTINNAIQEIHCLYPHREKLNTG